MKKEKKQTNSEAILSAFLSALTAALLMLLVIYGANYVIRDRYLVVEVKGESMMNTLKNGDVVYCDSKAELERGDIVIIDVSNRWEFAGADAETENIIKRVIAIGGDRIRCEDGVVYRSIDGGDEVPLYEDYIEGRNETSFEYTLGEGEIFVMGDNRQNSKDSRYLEEPLRAEDVLGVVPQWTIEYKAVITGWESINGFLFGWMQRSN